MADKFQYNKAERPKSKLITESSASDSRSSSAPSSKLGSSKKSSKVINTWVIPGPYLVNASRVLHERWDGDDRDPGDPSYYFPNFDSSIVIDGENFFVDWNETTSPKKGVNVILYCTNSLKTLSFWKETLSQNPDFFRIDNQFKFILLGLHHVPQNLFETAWPFQFSPNIRKNLESTPLDWHEKRQVPIEDVLRLAQSIGCPWTEIDFLDPSASMQVLQQIARMVINESKIPAPHPTMPHDSFVAWTLVGFDNKSILSYPKPILQEPRSIILDGDSVIICDKLNNNLKLLSLEEQSTSRTEAEKLKRMINFYKDPEKSIQSINQASLLQAENTKQPPFNKPNSMCLAHDGSGILIADSNNHRIRKFTPLHSREGQSASNRPSRSLATSNPGTSQTSFKLSKSSTLPTSDTHNRSVETTELDSSSIVPPPSDILRRVPKTRVRSQRVSIKDWDPSTMCANTSNSQGILLHQSMKLKSTQRHDSTPPLALQSENQLDDYFHGTISTLAGTGKVGYLDSSFESATFFEPYDIIYYPAENGYVVSDAGNNVLRLLKNGQVTTYAGTGVPRPQDGHILDACFNRPCGLHLCASDGSILIGDTKNNCIRKLYQDKVMTIAGCGNLRFADGPALKARFFHPSCAIETSIGEILICDKGNDRIRMLYKGVVSTIGGHSTNINYEGSLSTICLDMPSCIVETKQGDLIISDSGNDRVIYVSRSSENIEASNQSPPTNGYIYETFELFDDQERWRIIDATKSNQTPLMINWNGQKRSIYSIPELQLLHHYLFNPMLVSPYSFRWLQSKFLTLGSEKDLEKLLVNSNSRFYVRDPALDINEPVLQDTARNGLLSFSAFSLSKSVWPYQPVTCSLTITNQSKFPIFWALVDDIQTYTDILLMVYPTKGFLVSGQSQNISIIVNLLGSTEPLWKILRFCSSISNPPLVNIAPFLIDVSLVNHQQPGRTLRLPSPATPTAPPNLGFWDIDPELLQNMSRLGKGSAAVVFRAELHGLPVAVKRWDLGSKDAPPEEFQMELATLKSIRHPNLIRFIGARASAGTAFLVTQLATRGSLDCFLKDALPAEKTWSMKLKMALDAAIGLKFLHDQSLIHRDVKSMNFLVTYDLRLKVSDFGTTRELSSTLTQGVGSFDWMAPENYLSKHYSQKSDVYSFGLVLLELFTEDYPGRNFEEIAQGKIPQISVEQRSANPDYFKLIDRCCAFDADARPTMAEVVKSLTDLMRPPPKIKNDIPPLRGASPLAKRERRGAIQSAHFAYVAPLISFPQITAADSESLKLLPLEPTSPASSSSPLPPLPNL